MFGAGAVALLGVMIILADRLGLWVWAALAASAFALLGASLISRSARRVTSRAGAAVLDAMTEWWREIGPERRGGDDQLVPGTAGKQKPEAGPLYEAQGFLVSVLAQGPLKSNDLYRKAEEAGVARRTLYRAKARLGVEVRRVTHGNEGKGYWIWQLPDGLQSGAPDGRSAKGERRAAPSGTP